MGLVGGLGGCFAALGLSYAVAVMPAFGFVGALEIPPMLTAFGIVASILTATAGGIVPAVCAAAGSIVDQLRE